MSSYRFKLAIDVLATRENKRTSAIQHIPTVKTVLSWQAAVLCNMLAGIIQSVIVLMCILMHALYTHAQNPASKFV
jgi:hypothetical protein